MKKKMICCSVLLIITMLITACTPSQIETVTQTSSPTPAATETATTVPTPTPVPLSAITLKPGEYYFSVDGTQSLVFQRNLTAAVEDSYVTTLEWAESCGNKVIRLGADNIGTGYSSEGGVKGGVYGTWTAKWDMILDEAEENGVYVIFIFSGWMDWNIWDGPSNWYANPLNEANGGPVKSPTELFEKGSAIQTMWMEWMRTLVNRWKGHKNILAWEIYSEVNLTTPGVTEEAGIDFINTAAEIIRAEDPGRLITASLADIGTWPNFYNEADLDFIQIHPYKPEAQLDRDIVSEIRAHLDAYKRPVIIGECGLNAETPANYPKNEEIGLRHAVWAGVVSGSMNGRSLFWEDSFGQFFPEFGMPWLEKFSTIEVPAAEFVKGVDFAGFVPLKSKTTKGIWGAAIGNESSILGWYRDAGCEPPDYPMQEALTGQTVTITVPGNAENWSVDFYSTQDGATILGSVDVTRKGNTVTIRLPDFKDDIAFKAHVK